MDYQQCRVCGAKAVHVHHVLGGTANRKLSDKYNLVIRVCQPCHERFHKDMEFALHFKKLAQKKFQREHPELEFIKIFGRNYL